jgi:peptide/nickel transport system permease protein
MKRWWDAWTALPGAAKAGLLLTAGVLLLALLGPSLRPFDPTAIDLSVRLEPPSLEHWFGTDELGRDLFARIAYGARYSLLAAICVVASSVVIGCIAGGLSAMAPGWVDWCAMRLVDMLLSVPTLVLAMALAAALGPGLVNAIIALIIARIPTFVRLGRNQALVLRRQAYVEAARLYGAPTSYLVRRHLVPNIAPVAMVQGVSDVGGVILACAALGFIGLGAQPPTPEWGALAASGRLFFLDCWWYAAFPGLAIASATVGFNLLGDAARDYLDPHRRALQIPSVA